MFTKISSLFAFALLVPLGLSAQTPGREILFKESFNNPSDQTYFCPASPGTGYRRFHPVFSAWSRLGGQVSVQYANGYGLDMTGGLYLTVIKATPQGDHALRCESLKLPVTSPDLIGGYISGMNVDFAMNLPVGKAMNVYVLPINVPEDMKKQLFASRLTLAKINGDGVYRNYILNAGEAIASDGGVFLRFLKTCMASGMDEVRLEIVWHLNGVDWNEGDYLLFDEVVVSAPAR